MTNKKVQDIINKSTAYAAAQSEFIAKKSEPIKNNAYYKALITFKNAEQDFLTIARDNPELLSEAVFKIKENKQIFYGKTDLINTLIEIEKEYSL